MDELASRCYVNESSTPCKYTQKDFFTCNLVTFQQASELHLKCGRTAKGLFHMQPCHIPTSKRASLKVWKNLELSQMTPFTIVRNYARVIPGGRSWVTKSGATTSLSLAGSLRAS